MNFSFSSLNFLTLVSFFLIFWVLVSFPSIFKEMSYSTNRFLFLYKKLQSIHIIYEWISWRLHGSGQLNNGIKFYYLLVNDNACSIKSMMKSKKMCEKWWNNLVSKIMWHEMWNFSKKKTNPVKCCECVPKWNKNASSSLMRFCDK